MRPHEADHDHPVIRAVLDSGSDGDFVSVEKVTSMGLADQLQSIPEQRSAQGYAGFHGQLVYPEGLIELTWFASNEGASRTTKFLVFPESCPYDMILGRDFIADEGIFLFDRAALVLKHVIDPDEARQMEANAILRGANRQQIGQLRKSEEAAKREQRRRAKAASRMTISPGSVSSMSLILPTSSISASSHPGGGAALSQTPSNVSQASTQPPTPPVGTSAPAVGSSTSAMTTLAQRVHSASTSSP
ncbi:hypothetical protein LTS15_010992 [Exophiala xenobiotica]|nr:hypothetical protein LTS15_010992 [Exophiala xenobiotica]